MVNDGENNKECRGMTKQKEKNWKGVNIEIKTERQQIGKALSLSALLLLPELYGVNTSEKWWFYQ